MTLAGPIWEGRPDAARQQRAWAKAIDLALGAPQMALYGASIIGLLLRLGAEARIPHGSWQPALYLSVLLHASDALYLGLLTLLLIVRRTPVGSIRGVLPKLAALVGFSITGLLVLLPPAQMSPSMSLVSLTLTLGGTIASIYIATVLGRSFSIFPQARGLVVRGPYRFIRHPLYLAELVTVLGLMLQFAMPWSLLVALAVIVAQFPRMHYEEEVLSAIYPEYRAYMKHTARLVPGIY